MWKRQHVFQTLYFSVSFRMISQRSPHSPPPLITSSPHPPLPLITSSPHPPPPLITSSPHPPLTLINYSPHLSLPIPLSRSFYHIFPSLFSFSYILFPSLFSSSYHLFSLHPYLFNFPSLPSLLSLPSSFHLLTLFSLCSTPPFPLLSHCLINLTFFHSPSSSPSYSCLFFSLTHQVSPPSPTLPPSLPLARRGKFSSEQYKRRWEVNFLSMNLSDGFPNLRSGCLHLKEATD